MPEPRKLRLGEQVEVLRAELALAREREQLANFREQMALEEFREALLALHAWWDYLLACAREKSRESESGLPPDFAGLTRLREAAVLKTKEVLNGPRAERGRGRGPGAGGLAPGAEDGPGIF